MPNENPMTRDELRAFRNELTGSEPRAFDEMLTALKQPVRTRDLPWYQTFGQGVLSLRGDQGVAGRYGWITRLARALNCSTSLLHKTRDFARQYTLREALTLAREGLTWGLTYPTLVLQEKEERLRWARQAKEKNWSVHEFEKQLQGERQGPQRKGGRRKNELKSYGHAVDLPNLVRLSAEWLRHYHDVWTARSGLVGQLAAIPPADYSVKLLVQLKEAEHSLKVLVQAVSALKGQLQALRKKIKRALDSKN